MTAIALEADYARPEKTPLPKGNEEDRLWLMIAIMAPLSAGFWAGLCWASYRIFTLVLG